MSEETSGELQGILGDIKEEEQLVKLADKDGEEEEEEEEVDMSDELLEDGSSETLMESDVEEDLVKREEELLKDEEPLQNDDDSMKGENGEVILD